MKDYKYELLFKSLGTVALAVVTTALVVNHSDTPSSSVGPGSTGLAEIGKPGSRQGVEPYPLEAPQESASATIPGASADRGKPLFALNCAPCHGGEGMGNPVFGAPALAGQDGAYLARQLEKFRDGTRGSHPEDVQGMQMAPLLRLLPDDQVIKDVTAYLSNMQPFTAVATLDADPDKGKSLFAGTCLPCHGDKGQGNPLLKAPRLAGQADWYIARQIEKFKSGIRGAHEKDMEGMQMAAMAKSIMDEQAVRNLAAYINGLTEETAVKDDTVKVVSSQPLRGEARFKLNCAPCHGQDGQGDYALNAPALAGQHDWYLLRQLYKFADGTRGAHPEDVQGMQMAPMTRLLGDEASLNDVVAHLANLPLFDTKAALVGDSAHGKTIFSGSCLPCHGEKAQGNPILKAPRLAGQADWYLVRQLTKFKQGIRGAHEKDSEGIQMAAMAKTLMDENAIRDVAAYINELQ